MNPRGKEWIKKNWFRVAIHFLPLIILFYVMNSIFNIWIASLGEGQNVFVTVACFGALITFILILIYLDKWSDRFEQYKKECKEYVKEKTI